MNSVPISRSEVRFGIVGYGPANLIGEFHAARIASTSSLRVTAVCDIDPLRLDSAARRIPEVSIHTNLEEMLAADVIDAVVVATPNASHYRIAMECIQAGKHVVLEKPMTVSSLDARALIAAASTAGIVLTVHHNRRFDGEFLGLRHIVDSGRIGRPFHYELSRAVDEEELGWRAAEAEAGNPLWDWGSHLVDWLVQLAGVDISSVMSMTTRPTAGAGSVRAHTEILCRMEDGSGSRIQISTLGHARGWQFQIFGSTGTLCLRRRGRTFELWASHRSRSGRRLPIPPDQHHRFYENLDRHLLGVEELLVSPASAYHVVAAVEAAHQAAKIGGVVVPAQLKDFQS